jgi:hypothetical protein
MWRAPDVMIIAHAVGSFACLIDSLIPVGRDPAGVRRHGWAALVAHLL